MNLYAEISEYDAQAGTTTDRTAPVKFSISRGSVELILGEAEGTDPASPRVLAERRADGRWVILVHRDAGDPLIRVEVNDYGDAVVTDEEKPDGPGRGVIRVWHYDD